MLSSDNIPNHQSVDLAGGVDLIKRNFDHIGTKNGVLNQANQPLTARV